MKTDQDRVIALAGIFQAAALTQQIATRGMADQAPLSASIDSLFQMDAPDVPSVYGGLEGVELGLRQLIAQLSMKRSVDITRYVIQLIHLDGQLMKSPERFDAIGTGIAAAAERLAHFPMLHSNILAQLADIYKDNVSNLNPRIMVSGEPLHLQNSDNANRIRSLLLAGIRSARLWRQCGGKRLQILFGRKRVKLIAEALLTVIADDAAKA